ncbi:hypothetical protein HanRHA438_Chr13g0600661 [Helianthus annuus]|nr:hypothetical protein HanRHA438_Chr13g0600661 [Helianthus annuus]
MNTIFQPAKKKKKKKKMMILRRSRTRILWLCFVGLPIFNTGFVIIPCKGQVHSSTSS